MYYSRQSVTLVAALLFLFASSAAVMWIEGLVNTIATGMTAFYLVVKTD